MKCIADKLKILLTALVFNLLLPLYVLAADISPEQLFNTARQASLNADYEYALQTWRKLLEQYPDNADYLLGIGQTLHWQGHSDQAIPYLRRGIALAPDYEDIHITLFQALQMAGKADEAEIVRAAAADRFGTARWAMATLNTSSVQQNTGYHVSLSNQLEFPANGLANWRETTAEFGAHTPNDHRFAVQVQQTKRFRQSDLAWALNGFYKLADTTGILLAAGWSPDHHVIPEHRLQLQLNHDFSNGWGGIAGIGYAGYREADVTTADITIEKYIADYRLAYTLIRSDSNTAGMATAHRLQIGYYFPSSSNIQLGYTGGEEIEKLTDANTLLSSRVDTTVVWGEFRMTPSLGLVYSVGKTWVKPQDRARTDREFFRFGLNYYF